MPRKNISDATKRYVAGKQLYKCANKKNITLIGLEGYKCPLWYSDNNGSFDESGYDIDHIVEYSLTKDNSVHNLQALCKICHSVKTKKYMIGINDKELNKNVLIRHKPIINNLTKNNSLTKSDNELFKFYELIKN